MFLKVSCALIPKGNEEMEHYFLKKQKMFFSENEAKTYNQQLVNGSGMDDVKCHTTRVALNVFVVGTKEQSYDL